jgi:hypothetical protein
MVVRGCLNIYKYIIRKNARKNKYTIHIIAKNKLRFVYIKLFINKYDHVVLGMHKNSKDSYKSTI